jgi:sugar lactone lactonase YvrE
MIRSQFTRTEFWRGTGSLRHFCDAVLVFAGSLLVAAFPTFVSAQTNLGSINVGAGTTELVTVSIPAAGTVSSIAVLTQGSPNLDFTNGNGGSCAIGAAYGAGETCTVNVTFKPRFAGTRYGAIVLSDSSGVIATAWLQGTGIAPQDILLPGTQSFVQAGNEYYSYGIALDGAGNVYVANLFSPRINPNVPLPGAVYKSLAASGFNDQITIGSGFQSPSSVAVDSAGNVYVLDVLNESGQSTLYKETLANGSYIQSEIGSGFQSAWNVAVDGDGNVYVADEGWTNSPGSVYKETLQPDGSYLQTTIGSGFVNPYAVAVDGNGNVYVADVNLITVFKLTLSGSEYIQSSISGPWVYPDGLALDGTGDLYVADGGKIPSVPGSIYKVTSSNGSNELINFPLIDENQYGPFGCEPVALAVDGSGNLWTATLVCSVLEINLLNPPSHFFQLAYKGETSFDSPWTVTVANQGNAPLKFSDVSYPPNFPEGNNAANNCTSTTTLPGGNLCYLPIDYTPTASLNGAFYQVLVGDVSIETNAIDVSGGEQKFQVEGQEYPPWDNMFLNVSADPSIVGNTITFTLTMTGTYGTPTGTITFSSGSTALGPPVAMSGGVATFSTASFPIGSYTITALYSGDSNYPPREQKITENVIGPPTVSSAGDISIGTVSIGSASDVIPVMFTFSATETLGSIAVVTQGHNNQEFQNAGGGSCITGTVYPANSTCTVNIVFMPRYAGTRTGGVVLHDAAGNVIANGYLQGTGLGPQVTYFAGTKRWFSQSFVSIAGVAIDGDGTLYVVDSGDLFVEGGTTPGVVYKEIPDGTSFKRIATIGTGLRIPWGVAVDGSGNVYIADNQASGVYKETLQPDGSYVQSTIGYGFGQATGIAVDSYGNVYVADDGSLTISGGMYKETYSNGSYIQSVFGSGIVAPASVAVDGSGDVYIGDLGGHADVVGSFSPVAVYKETPSGAGYTQSTIGSGWFLPFAMAVDGDGNLYVVDYDQASVYKETPSNGGYIQTTMTSDFYTVNVGFQGVAVDPKGNLYVTDDDVPEFFIVDFSDPPALTFANTAYGSTSADSPQTVSVTNLGNADLTFSQLTYPSDFPQSASGSNNCTLTTQLGSQANCNLPINFLPLEPLDGNVTLALKEALTLTTNTQNTSATQQQLSVSGTEIEPFAATPVLAPGQGEYTTVQSVTITDATPNSTIYYITNANGTPTTKSTVYTGAITVSSPETIQAIAVAAGYNNSAIAKETYLVNLPPPDFTVAAAPASITVSAGQSGTTTITVTPANGFDSTVSFSCSGLPAGATCGFSPATVKPSGASVSTTLKVTTSSTTPAVARNKHPLVSAVVLAVFLCCLGGKRRRRWQRLFLFAFAAIGLSFANGCGGGGSTSSGGGGTTNPPPPVTTTVTVTATSAALSHSTALSLTVN